MIDSRIDWAGSVPGGQVGQVYIVGYDSDGWAVRPDQWIARRVEGYIVPKSVCLEIARRQLSNGWITQQEYETAVQRINSQK